MVLQIKMFFNTSHLLNDSSGNCTKDEEQRILAEIFKNKLGNTSVAWVRDMERRYEPTIQVLEYFTSTLCILGIIGNILNILVLSKKGLLVSMERMERSAHCSLLALALSDLLFCASALPLRLWVSSSEHMYHGRSFSLYYAVYSEGIINTFLLSSTWLTVTMAMSRYLAICFPFRARQVIGMRFAKISIVLVFILCILFNIPKYYTWKIEPNDDLYCHTVYQKSPGPLLEHKVLQLAYRWTYFVAGIMVPLTTLTYCNINLVRALQKSSRMQASLRASHTRTANTTNHITLIFIIIIVLYLVMVTPGELILFAREIASETDLGHIYFNLALTVTNACQAFNFAFNFLLYTALNTHFRSQLLMLVQCTSYRSRFGTQRSQSPHRVETSNTDQLLNGCTAAIPMTSNGKFSTSMTFV